jgi:hypothetical protein
LSVRFKKLKSKECRNIELFGSHLHEFEGTYLTVYSTLDLFKLRSKGLRTIEKNYKKHIGSRLCPRIKVAEVLKNFLFLIGKLIIEENSFSSYIYTVLLSAFFRSWPSEKKM